MGAIAGTASPNSTIELFLADPSPSVYGSGKTYCGTAIANGSGSFSFSGVLLCVPGSARITATSTLADGSTSEFGVTVLPTRMPTVYLPLVKR
jgi:hypothetical protein